MSPSTHGRLIIIGGHEDRDPAGNRTILHEIARCVRPSNPRCALLTVATTLPDEVAAEYQAAFHDLDVTLTHVAIRTRADAADPATIHVLEQAAIIFFSGGDQLRLTSLLGGTPAFTTICARYQAGATIAGTSAGAAAMAGTMIVGGTSDASFRMNALDMAPGLGFLPHSVVDTHFAERGRIGRLMGAVAQNPRTLGLGIDEDTAIVVEGEQRFRVVGSGAVYVVNGQPITYTSLTDHDRAAIVHIHDAQVDILGQGSTYDLSICRALRPED